MCYFYIYDAVANAIIERNRICGENNILLDDAINYERKVVQLLQEAGYFAKMKVIDDRSIISFENEYKDYFIPYFSDDKKGYFLSEDKNIEEIISVFRRNVGRDMVSFFSDIRAIRELNLDKYCFLYDKFKSSFDDVADKTLFNLDSLDVCVGSNCLKKVLVKKEESSIFTI